MFQGAIETLVGGLLWGVANFVYYDMRRRGKGGFGRFAAFWVGTPTTWITLFAVRADPAPSFDPPEDEAKLFAEVRRDRAQRGLTAPDSAGDEIHTGDESR